MTNFVKSILFVLATTWMTSAQADVTSYFQKIKTDPNALYAFFKEMPKGGELHYHLAGGPSPEVMLSLVNQNNHCLNTETFSVDEENDQCHGVKTKEITDQPALYDKIVRSWSFKDFVPGVESAHDHFFNGFMKYMFIVVNYRPQLIAHVIKRAAEQNEHYLEIMDIADNAHSTSFGKLIANTPTYPKKKDILLNNEEFQKNINYTIEESERMELQAKEELGCATNPQSKNCLIKIKFQYYVLREQTPNNFFAQALNAFAAVSRSKGNLIGVNLVQPEDGVISLRDYQQQMRVFNYLHTQYPQVHIALHAGELTPDLVSKQDLAFHIHEALFIGKAERIGHGVDITHEANAKTTLAYMAKQQIPVEINLSSNLHILNVSGSQHPLKYYLDHQVPVVLSTDDEGVLRTDLTQQYVTAAIEHQLDYQTLKHINRNTLTYAFIPGQSIWTDANKALAVVACQDLDSSACIQFISKNEKAHLQWDLEKSLAAFEKKISFK
jgi:adenosine deaminase